MIWISTKPKHLYNYPSMKNPLKLEQLNCFQPYLLYLHLFPNVLCDMPTVSCLRETDQADHFRFKINPWILIYRDLTQKESRTIKYQM